MIYRNLAATAKLFKHCLVAGKNLRPDIAKGDVEEMNVPKEPDKIVQMVFWEPVKYVKRRKKTPS